MRGARPRVALLTRYVILFALICLRSAIGDVCEVLAERPMLFALARVHWLLELREHTRHVFMKQRAARYVFGASVFGQFFATSGMHRR